MKHTDPVDCILCRCHGEIDGVVDFGQLQKQLEDDSRLRSVSVGNALCLDGELESLAECAGGRRPGKVLIGACSFLARGDALIAGLENCGISRDRVFVADIREGCAWLHADRPGKATRKATDIVRMGMTALRHREVSADVNITVQPRVLVIGGGPAGMAAAVAAGRAGVAVDLVETSGQLGGMLNRLSRVAPGDRSAEAILTPLLEAIQAIPMIRVHTGTRVSEIRGSAGDFDVSLASKTGSARLSAGAVIVATGAKPVLPNGQYRYGQLSGVISGMELEKILKVDRSVGGNTVFIQCADVRNSKRPYCSAICCPAALKNAIRLKEIDPGAEVTIVHRDIMTPGHRLEADYRRATAAGGCFIRFAPENPPRIEGDNRVTGIRVTDILAGRERHLKADRVVLGTAVEPRIKTDRDDPVMTAIGLAADTHGFYRVQPFLHTVETDAAGVFVCGTARWPVMVDGAMAQGKAAAAKAMDLVAHPVRKASRLIGFQAVRFACARVSPTTCSGCGNCAAVCPYNACGLEKTEHGLRAAVNPVRCMGCGSCTAACPNGSISLPELGATAMVRMIENAFTAGNLTVSNALNGVADRSAPGCRDRRNGGVVNQ